MRKQSPSGISPPFMNIPTPSLDDCDRPACEDTVSALSAALNRVKEKNQKHSQNKLECPPKKDFIGSSTWTLLHSMAAWYPENPTPTDEKHMKNLITSLGIFYPCTWCAQDFRQSIEQKPVK